MFKLNFDTPVSDQKINLKDKLLLIGSCFSENMGSTLSENKFQVLSNPYGTIYNPTSIFKLLRDEATLDGLIESQGVFYHWDCHGSISGLTKQETEEMFNVRCEQSNSFIKDADWLIITLGTSIVYRLKATNQIVANCHKVSASSFEKSYLSVEEITSDFKKTYDYLKQINPTLNIILTVSPVRHIKDGLVENNLSKSILLQAVHQIVASHSHAHYFPSYEIMMDELRDYRFYKKDMIHPSEEAVEYIWDRFVATYFDEKARDFLLEWIKIRSALHHRPFQPKSQKHQQFLENTLEQLKKLNDLVDTSVERKMIQKQLQ